MITKLKDYKDPIGLKIKTPKGVIGYYHAKSTGGILLSQFKDETVEGRLYPQIGENTEEWTVLDEDDTTAINCDRRTTQKDIMNL